MNTFAQAALRVTPTSSAIAELATSIALTVDKSEPQISPVVTVATADPFERLASALHGQQISLAVADASTDERQVAPVPARLRKPSANSETFSSMQLDENDDGLDDLLSGEQHDDCDLAPREEKARLRAGIGRRLCLARQLAGLTQTDAAKLFGYQTPAQLSMWELGRRPIPMERLVRAACAYAVSSDFLLGLADEPERDTALALRNSTLRGVRSMLAAVARSTADAVDKHAKLLGPDATRAASLVASGEALVDAAQAFVRSNHEIFDELPGGARLQRCTAEFETEAAVTRTRLNAYRTLDLELRAQIADCKAGIPGQADDHDGPRVRAHPHARATVVPECAP